MTVYTKAKNGSILQHFWSFRIRLTMALVFLSVFSIVAYVYGTQVGSAPGRANLLGLQHQVVQLEQENADLSGQVRELDRFMSVQEEYVSSLLDERAGFDTAIREMPCWTPGTVNVLINRRVINLEDAPEYSPVVVWDRLRFNIWVPYNCSDQSISQRLRR